MNITVTGAIFEWRGPAPFLFVAIPEEVSSDIKALSRLVSYGWGVIPVTARIGNTTWTTSLFPKKGQYLIPIKVVVQKAEHVGAGDVVEVEVHIG